MVSGVGGCVLCLVLFLWVGGVRWGGVVWCGLGGVVLIGVCVWWLLVGTRGRVVVVCVCVCVWWLLVANHGRIVNVCVCVVVVGGIIHN